MPRRDLLLLGVAAAVVLVVAGVAVALTQGDDDHAPRLAGRIAAREGCGLRHMWPDGSDVRELCLPGITANASLSFDGKTLAWDSVQEKTFSIMVAGADAFNPRRVPLLSGANVAPSLSPDGEEVAYLHSPKDDGRYDVWTTSTSAPFDESQQVTALHSVSSVAWSPKGDRLAYVANWSDETLEGDMFSVRPNGDDVRSLGRGDVPSWSPDGKRLAFYHDGGIWTMSSDGSDRRLLVREGDTPSWSRDGSLIAFEREPRCRLTPCKRRVYVVSADGGNPHMVGPEFRDARQIIWLPDPNE